MNEKGVTLLETLVVIVLVALILLVSVPFTLRQMLKTRTEGEIRTLYSSLAEARQRTLQKNAQYIVTLTDTTMTIYQDANNDGVGQPSEKVNALSVTLGPKDYIMTGDVGGAAFSAGSPQTFIINAHGMMLTSAKIFLQANPPTDPAVLDAFRNCIKIETTRIGQGKYNGSFCETQ